MQRDPFFQGHERERKIIIETALQAEARELARHLPPSDATLRLIDVECGPGNTARALLALRPDVQLVGLDISLDTLRWAPIALRSVIPHQAARVLQSETRRLPFAAQSADAIVAHRTALLDDHDFLGEARRVLRPGGRLIVFDSSSAKPSTAMAHSRILDSAGFARVLGERGISGYGVLVRGEKPYPIQTPEDPVTPVIDTPDGLTSLDAARLAQTPGRYVFLLIRQTPNRPVWSLPPDTLVVWDAASTFDRDLKIPAALAFSSLPKAVAFMRPAVTANVLIGVTRIARFDKTIAAHWSFPVLLNPTFELLRRVTRYDFPGVWLPIDPADAQSGGE